MSVCQQAIRARRKSKLDKRYRYKQKDLTVRARKLNEQVQNERARQMRSKAKK